MGGRKQPDKENPPEKVHESSFKFILNDFSSCTFLIIIISLVNRKVKSNHVKNVKYLEKFLISF